MKVGIITFHCAHNYGAVLQAYALNKVISNFGATCETIDYRPAYLVNQYKPFQKNNFKERMKKLVFYSKYKAILKRWNLFEDFIKNCINLTNKSYFSYDDILKNPPLFDKYICGSDQIWNPYLLGGKIDPAYFLEFTKSFKESVAIAYAPSFGSNFIAENLRIILKEKLANIDILSTREEAGSLLIKELTGRYATVVQDPTLLLSIKDWDSLSEPARIAEPYILCYTNKIDDVYLKVLNKLRNTFKLPVVHITAGVSLRNPLGADYLIHDLGPREFLGFFRNAAAVLTNSFHGTAFSIIYEIPFIVTPISSKDTRIQNLLNNLNLRNQLIIKDHEFSGKLMNISFEEPKRLLKIETDRSIAFLKSALGLGKI